MDILISLQSQISFCKGIPMSTVNEEYYGSVAALNSTVIAGLDPWMLLKVERLQKTFAKRVSSRCGLLNSGSSVRSGIWLKTAELGAERVRSQGDRQCFEIGLTPCLSL